MAAQALCGAVWKVGWEVQVNAGHLWPEAAPLWVAAIWTLAWHATARPRGCSSTVRACGACVHRHCAQLKMRLLHRASR